MKQPAPIFILPEQPAPDDTRERNAFGYLTGFGKACAAHYARRCPDCRTEMRPLAGMMDPTLQCPKCGYETPDKEMRP
jgi:hypothetical protein